MMEKNVSRVRQIAYTILGMLLVCMILTQMPVKAEAAKIISSEQYNGWSWSIDSDGKLLVEGTVSGYFIPHDWSWDENVDRITSAELNDTISINGMQVKTYVVNSDDLETIKFETESTELMVDYYYQTMMNEIESDNIVQDIKLSINGNLQRNNTVTLKLKFKDTTGSQVRIDLPNSLRLAQNYSSRYEIKNTRGYYLISNKIDYITLYKNEGISEIEIPLIVCLDGSYTFENIVQNIDGVYHISNSMELNIK